MCVWDGWPQQPESERESAWIDSEGDLPFLPDTLAETWDAAMEDLAGPEYRLWKRRQHEEEDDGA